MHWHEGLFLLPHHLQWMQRDLHERDRADRALLRAFPYGVVEMQVAADDLGEYKVRFDKLHVVMPSGVEVEVGKNAEVGVREFRQKFREMSGGMVVSLGVPLWQSGRANSVSVAGDGALSGDGSDSSGPSAADPAMVSCLYAVTMAKQVADENTGKNPHDVMLRRINARLVFPGEDTTNLETIPIMRLEAAGTDDGIRPREDPTFLPPCFGIGGAPALRVLLRDLASAVGAHRQELAQKLGGPGVGWSPANLNPLQMLRVMRLRTLNHFTGVLQTMVAAGAVAPFDVYLSLRGLLGELAALAPDRDPFEALPYDHDKPGPVFRDLDRRIRPLLRESSLTTIKEIRFGVEGRYLKSEPLDPADFASGVDFLLGIHSKMDPNELTKLVANSAIFALAPSRFLGAGAETANVPGVKLERDFGVPAELPQPRGMNYFRLIPSADERMWRWVQEDKRMCIIWNQFQKFEYEKVSLFITLPQAGAAAQPKA
jgi:type VI secretion system ImpJ/VasE family protein